jgi:hypothetical protein
MPQKLQSASNSVNFLGSASPTVFDPMRNVYKALSLLLLLLTAQQGAVNHELSHFSPADQADLRIDTGGVADALCALCPAFAQAVAPTFGHSFNIPLLVRTTSQVVSEPRFVAVDAAVPRPRSRGPPVLS